MLGSLLFVIFIIDLPDQVNLEIFLFVDDTKIFRNIKGPDDQKLLQDDINTMLQWADKSQLQLHPDKCVSMSINNKEGRNWKYNMKEIELNSQDKRKIWGDCR